MNVGLWLTQLLAIRIFLSHPRDRRMFLRHEDFLDDPSGVTRQILEMLGSRAELPDLQALNVGAPLEGNQLIRSASVAIRPAVSHRPPRDAMTRFAQAMWAPLLRRLRPAAKVGERAAEKSLPRESNPPETETETPTPAHTR
jgi:hypothetical protein